MDWYFRIASYRNIKVERGVPGRRGHDGIHDYSGCDVLETTEAVELFKEEVWLLPTSGTVFFKPAHLPEGKVHFGYCWDTENPATSSDEFAAHCPSG